MGKRFDITLVFDFIPTLLSFLPITLFILFASVILGLIIGLLAAVSRLYNIPVFSQIAAVYVSFVRGTPTLIQLFIIYYGMPELLKLVSIDISKWPSLIFVIITYGLSTGAVFSESIRAAINAIDRGQLEAAQSIGMTGPQSFKRIVFPQALTIAFPNLANTIIGALKDTSLAYSVGVMDMVGRGDALGANTKHFFEVYITLAIIYYAVVIVFEKGFRLTEKRLQRHERRLVAT